MDDIDMNSVVAAIGDGTKLKKIGEGKTKEIYEIPNYPALTLIRSKDRITAFNAQRQNMIEGKAEIANDTTCHVFHYLKSIGLNTHFIAKISDTEFLARRCAMIPLEWVARRVATGSFLKRNPGVQEGYWFDPAKLEIFYKDDENNDPQWSEEQVIAQGITASGVTVKRPEVDLMKRVTVLVFEALEKAWDLKQCALIDMKVEFGVTAEGELVLADVIDNDSWRVWPAGDKRLQLDKQFYRDLDAVTDDALTKLKENYAKVAGIVKSFTTPVKGRAVILMGSKADNAYATAIQDACSNLGVPAIKRVSSAHKTTETTLDIIAQYKSDRVPTVFIAVAGRSNGLGPVTAGNTTFPVINAPPLNDTWSSQDIWSSLRMPSGLGCTTVIGAEEAALAAAKILSLVDHMIFGRLLVQQLKSFVTIMKADAAMEKDNDLKIVSPFARKYSVANLNGH
uniref:PurE domain-containing protein n=1 Tax=Plectus sambesii TaxID=2011161 RepID=A0A914WAM5_9BILA